MQYISIMSDIYFDQKTKSLLLNRGKISACVELDNFAELHQLVIHDLRCKPDLQKDAHTGWIPAKFVDHVSVRHPEWGTGLWRDKDGEIDEITSLVIDIDVADDFVGVPVQWHEVVERLPGISLFGYTSYSSTPHKPRYRLVIETDRPMTRSEVRQMTAWVSWLACNRQADMSMADAAHYAISPAHHAEVYHQLGKPLPVDATLALKAQQELADPSDTYLKDTGYSRAKTPAKPATPHPNATITAQRTTSPADWLSKAEMASYASPANGHWQTMYSLLKTAFYRSRGMLTFGDMQVVAAEIDRHAGNYFQNKYSSRQLTERITQAMSDADLSSFRDNWMQARKVAPPPQPKIIQHSEYRQRMERLRAKVDLI